MATAKLPGLSAHFTIEAGREPAITEDGYHRGYRGCRSSASRGSHGGRLVLGCIQRVSDAGQTVCESVEAAVHALEAGRQARLAGRPMSEIVDELISGGGRDVRLGAAQAFLQFEREIQSMRVEVIRAMVDEEGLSITEASARLGYLTDRRAPASTARNATAQLEPPLNNVTNGPRGTP